MWSSRATLDSDACPVSEDILGQLYRASAEGLPQLVASVSPDVRAMLALFCYRRAHLHAMGLAIAATCTERDLVEQGGIVGSTLYAASREAHAPAVSSSTRRAISLSTAPLTTVVPDMDDDLDDAFERAFAAAVVAS